MNLLNREEILEKCGRLGAILTNNHVVLTEKPEGFFHAPGYFDKDRALSNAQVAMSIGKIFAERFLDSGIDVVVGPTYGAVGLAAIVACWMARLGDREITWAFAQEKTESGLYRPVLDGDKLGDAVKLSRPLGRERVVGRYFPEIVNGANILVVEDVFASGGSAMETVKAVQAVGGKVVAVAVICNRGGVTKEDLGVPDLEVMFDIPMEMFPEDDCPLCKSGVPVNEVVGHSKQFYERHPESAPKR